MNFLIFVPKGKSKAHNLFFVVPDGLADADMIKSLLPQRYLDKYDVIAVNREQPTVASDLGAILRALKDGE
jgi:hypothetical protein